jgi:hypothetical protein
VLISSTFPVAQNQTRGTLASTHWRLRGTEADRPVAGTGKAVSVEATYLTRSRANGGFATD